MNKLKNLVFFIVLMLSLGIQAQTPRLFPSTPWFGTNFQTKTNATDVRSVLEVISAQEVTNLMSSASMTNAALTNFNNVFYGTNYFIGLTNSAISDNYGAAIIVGTNTTGPPWLMVSNKWISGNYWDFGTNILGNGSHITISNGGLFFGPAHTAIYKTRMGIVGANESEQGNYSGLYLGSLGANDLPLGDTPDGYRSLGGFIQIGGSAFPRVRIGGKPDRNPSLVIQNGNNNNVTDAALSVIGGSHSWVSSYSAAHSTNGLFTTANDLVLQAGSPGNYTNNIYLRGITTVETNLTVNGALTTLIAPTNTAASNSYGAAVIIGTNVTGIPWLMASNGLISGAYWSLGTNAAQGTGSDITVSNGTIFFGPRHTGVYKTRMGIVGQSEAEGGNYSSIFIGSLKLGDIPTDINLDNTSYGGFLSIGNSASGGSGIRVGSHPTRNPTIVLQNGNYNNTTAGAMTIIGGTHSWTTYANQARSTNGLYTIANDLTLMAGNDGTNNIYLGGSTFVSSNLTVNGALTTGGVAYNITNVLGGTTTMNKASVTNFTINGNSIVMTNGSIFMGANAGNNSVQQAFMVGNSAGNQASSATYSTIIGYTAGQQAANAHDSFIVGQLAGRYAANAVDSIFIGQYAGRNGVNADKSTFLGYHAGEYATNASDSIFVGSNAGLNATNSANSIFLGENSGNTISRANTLAIHSSAADVGTNALIYGEFDNRILRINGNLNISTNLTVNGALYGNGAGLTNITAASVSDALTNYETRNLVFSNDLTVGGITYFKELRSSYPGNNIGIGSNVAQVASAGTLNVAIGASALAKNTNGSYNVALGAGAMGLRTNISESVAIGYMAQNADGSGYYNTAVGTYAQTAITSGLNNTAVGNRAQSSLTSGNQNTAIGNFSQRKLTTGNYNNAVGDMTQTELKTGYGNNSLGYNSLASVVSGSWNIGIGDNALLSDTTGGGNIAIGASALVNNTNGSDNLAIGYNAVFYGTNVTGTTAIGYEAQKNLQSGTANTAVGYQSQKALTTGNSNVGLGWGTQSGLTNGVENTAIGTSSERILATGSYNTAVGVASQGAATSGDNNTTVGYYSQYGLKGGTLNVALGNEAQRLLTAGGQNVGIGYRAQYSVGPGNLNVGIGSVAQFFNTNGSSSIGIGSYAQQQATNLPDGSIAVGYQAQQSLQSGGANTAIGYQSQNALVTGVGNSALGYNAQVSLITGIENTAIGSYVQRFLKTGGNNVAVGSSAQQLLVDGGHNVSVGVLANYANTNGSYNVAIGSGALQNATNITGTVAIGYLAQQNLQNGVNNTAIGYQAQLAMASGSYNTHAGSLAAHSAIVGAYNSGFGYGTHYYLTSGSDNSAFGANAQLNLTTGIGNASFGTGASRYISDGSYNTAIGGGAMSQGASISYNTAIGSAALYTMTNGQFNTAVGQNSMYYAQTANNNASIGYYAGAWLTNAQGMLMIGSFSGTGVNAADNASSMRDTNCTFIGTYSGRSSTIANTTPLTNATSIGYNAKAIANNTVTLGGTGAGAVALVLNPMGAQPTNIPPGFAYFYSVTNTTNTIAEMYVSGGDGVATQISPHADDAPPQLYDLAKNDMKEIIWKETNPYITNGMVSFINMRRMAKLTELNTRAILYLSGQNTTSTSNALVKLQNMSVANRQVLVTENFSEYNARTGNDLKPLDWQEMQDKVQATYNMQRENIDLQRSYLSQTNALIQIQIDAGDTNATFVTLPEALPIKDIRQSKPAWMK